MSSFSYSLLALLSLAISLCLVNGQVPSSQTFRYINEGEFGDYITEYDASYRILPISAFPFQLFFYNITPNAYTLGLRLGHPRSESSLRWVWDANRGKPVKENATLTFGQDGNLVLAEADGTIVWQTGTANKGVVGLKLLPNGNLVLHDRANKFVWQSFDHPTDTMMVGQVLRSNGPSKLVSRMSSVDGSEGHFSFVLEKNNWAMYFKRKNTEKPMVYYKSEVLITNNIVNLELYCEPVSEDGAYDIGFNINGDSSNRSASYLLSRPKFNSTYSILRVESDGNLKVYTYNEKVDYRAWDIPYKLFDRDNWQENQDECRLLSRCGSLGVCEDNQCVACPMPQGLLGWSKTCTPPKLPACRGGANVDYYKVVGVEHFLNVYNEGDGPIKVANCRENCNKDCGCLGFFYREESSKCLLAQELGTLARVSNASHVAYIKRSK